MRRGVARLGRLMLAAALAYLIVGIIWQTAFYLAREPSVAELGSPWEGLLALLGWFVALVIGRTPKGMRDLSAYCLRYRAQTLAYVILLTSRYPTLNAVSA